MRYRDKDENKLVLSAKYAITQVKLLRTIKNRKALGVHCCDVISGIMELNFRELTDCTICIYAKDLTEQPPYFDNGTYMHRNEGQKSTQFYSSMTIYEDIKHE